MVTMVTSAVNSTTTDPWPDVTNTTVAPVGLIEHSEALTWLLVCLVGTVCGLTLATVIYFKDQYDLPENKKKRREKAEAQKREREQKLVEAVKERPVLATEFLDALKRKKKDKSLNIEVRAVVQNQEDHPCIQAILPEHISLNNHLDVVTYDHSRVILHDLPENIQSDYTNASFIEGYGGIPNEYIATQGPSHKNKASIQAFWHMIWQEGVHCIVMTTALFEHAVQQCAKYWEDLASKNRSVKFGDLEVIQESLDSFMHMTVRSLKVIKDGCGSRVVKQFELSGWGEQDEPDTALIVEYRRRVRLYTDSTTGPMVVHCKDGGGRTAVFVAVDYCLKQLEMENSVDIYSTVLHLRKFRKNMVRTLAQYRTVYDTVANFILSGHTVIPSTHLPALVQRLSVKDPRINATGIEREFKILDKGVKKIALGECAAGHLIDNRNKSRDIMLQPPERCRPCLQTGESVNDTDYVNAVFVDGYKTTNTFIVTQWPYRNTINDLWRLIYDHGVDSLVVLNDVKHCRNYPCFWPKKVGNSSDHRFGPIGVKYINCIKYPHVIIRVFQIRKLPKRKLVKTHEVGDLIKRAALPSLVESLQESMNMMTKLASLTTKGQTSPIQWHYLKMFQIRAESWPSKEKIPSAIDPMVYLLNFVEEWQENNSVQRKPVCVLSKDGVVRCGLFCAISVNCSKLQKEGDVDIFSTVRMIKKNRPPLVTSMEYSYCYTFLAKFVELLQETAPHSGLIGDNAVFGPADREESNVVDEEAALLSRHSSMASFQTAVEDAQDLADGRTEIGQTSPMRYIPNGQAVTSAVKSLCSQLMVSDDSARSRKDASMPDIEAGMGKSSAVNKQGNGSNWILMEPAYSPSMGGRAEDSRNIGVRLHDKRTAGKPVIPTKQQQQHWAARDESREPGYVIMHSDIPRRVYDDDDCTPEGSNSDDDLGSVDLTINRTDREYDPSTVSLASSYTTAGPRLGYPELGGSTSTVNPVEDVRQGGRVEMSRLGQPSAPLALEELDVMTAL